MSWIDRLRPAAYTSPRGVRTAFQYENVSLDVEKRTTAYQFPDADGTFIQDRGASGRQYPLRIFLSGENYDTQAETFLNSLLERGAGRLEHPIYGVVDVVPFGRIRRRDDLRDAANQAVFEVAFWATTGLVYPTVQLDPASGVIASVAEYNTAAAEQFAENIDLSTAEDRVSFTARYNQILGTVEESLRPVADTLDTVGDQFDAISTSINQGLEVLIGTPIALASQTYQLIQAPARSAAAIQARLESYGNLIRELTVGDNVVAAEGLDNDYYTQDMYVSTYVTGSILSTVNNQFTSRTDTIEAADTLLQQFADVTAWRDNNLESLGAIDTGESYQQLLNAVSLAAGFLVEISFDLRPEKSIVLDRNRTLIDIAAEYYGSVSNERIDFLITSNQLSGIEILEVPRGREIVLYV